MTAESDSPELERYEESVEAKIRLLMEYLIPLPCLDYKAITGKCDGFECLSLDGDDPLCRTKRLLGEQLTDAIGMNKYDPSHPGYRALPAAVTYLIHKADALKNGEPFPPPWMKRMDNP